MLKFVIVNEENDGYSHSYNLHLKMVNLEKITNFFCEKNTGAIQKV